MSGPFYQIFVFRQPTAIAFFSQPSVAYIRLPINSMPFFPILYEKYAFLQTGIFKEYKKAGYFTFREKTCFFEDILF